MKVIDTFMYFDEDMMLDLRLNILNQHVSKFIICEATYNHNGKKKKLNFDLKKFSKFKSKIEYIVLDKEPENLKIINLNDANEIKESKTLDNALIRENFQRNFSFKRILDFDDNDLILVNDLDEIPKLEKFHYKKKITIFKQKVLYYKFNLMYPQIFWTGSKICKKKDLLSPQWLRNVKTRKYPLWRFDLLFSKKKYNNIEIIDDGGWHFTNIKSAEQIHFKLINFLHHYEYERSGLKPKDIDNFIKEKKAIYNYSVDQRADKWSNTPKLERIDLDLLPDYIKNNKEKLKTWFEI